MRAVVFVVEHPAESEGPLMLTDAQIDAALRRLDADVRDRLIVFDGGPALMAWDQAHRHHADVPYIGCVFCQDEFVEALRNLKDAGEPFHRLDLDLDRNYVRPDEWAEICKPLREALVRAGEVLAREPR